MGECLVFTRQKWKGRREREKADRTRSGGGCCSWNNYPQQPKPLDVSGRRSITLHRNLSVTPNFLRPQTGVKKETPPGGAGELQDIQFFNIVISGRKNIFDKTTSLF